MTFQRSGVVSGLTSVTTFGLFAYLPITGVKAFLMCHPDQFLRLLLQWPWRYVCSCSAALLVATGQSAQSPAAVT